MYLITTLSTEIQKSLVLPFTDLASKAWEMYEADKRIEGYSQQTLKAYKLQSVLLIRFFKDVPIDTVTTDQLKA